MEKNPSAALFSGDNVEKRPKQRPARMKRSKEFLLIRLTFILFAIHIVTCKLITLLIHLNNI